MRTTLRLLSILLLAAPLSAAPRAAAIPTVQLSAQLLAKGIPGVSASASSVISRHVETVAKLVGEGPVAVVERNGRVLLIPTAARAGMQAVTIAADGSEAAGLEITRDMAAGLKQALKADDAAGAAAAFAAVYEKSAPASAVAVDVPFEAVIGKPGTAVALARAPRAPKKGDDKAEPPAPQQGDDDKAKPKYEGAKPLRDLRPEDVVASTLPDLDSALEMTISHSYPGKPGSDPTKQVADFIDEYAATKDVPKADKHLILTFFEIGDTMNGGHSKVVEAIERAAKAGLKITILTDFNQSAEGVFPKDEPHNTDFEKMTYKKGGPGKALQYLREQVGFKLRSGGQLTVLSGVPFFNPREKGEKPLMHEKGAFALGAGGKAWGKAVSGTANMNATEEAATGALPAYGGRYNRILISKDPASNQFDWEEVSAMLDSFDKRLSNKGIPEERDFRKRVTYKTGEYRELLRTNGRQNPNDRITAQLLRAAQSLADAKAKGQAEPDFAIEEIVFSHFVFTNTPEMDALRKYLDALRDFYPNDYKKKLKVFAVFDQQFIAADGFGEVAALNGELVQRPMGKSIFPFRTEYQEMMDLHGYVRLLDGTDTIDPDGAPTKVHIWHDKTTIMKVRENGKRWTRAWTRSLNNSGHYQSFESQEELQMLPESRLAKEFEDSVKETAKAEGQYVLPLDKVIAMFALAHASHHTVYDQGLAELADKFIAALSKAGYDVVGDLLNQALALPTKHAKGVQDAAKVKDRIGKFVGFLAWYQQQRAADKTLNFMTYRKAINVLVGLTTGSAWNMRTALDVLFWGPNRGPEQMEALMRKAWTEGLKLDLAYPEPKPRPAA